MRLVIDLAIAIAIAIVIGVSSAWIAVERGRLFGAVTVGDWVAWPQEGSTEADPYSLAMLARTGELPLGSGEGLSFTADRDTDGAALTGACSYEIAGETPAARMWTLTAYDSAGRLMVNVARRPGFHSREIVRNTDGTFVIVVSTAVAAGNWLPIAPVNAFSLVLRLYDTPLTTGSQIGNLVMPDIHRVACS
jgi:hypothetical protein